jgi:hypothetical protein
VRAHFLDGGLRGRPRLTRFGGVLTDADRLSAVVLFGAVVRDRARACEEALLAFVAVVGLDGVLRARGGGRGDD